MTKKILVTPRDRHDAECLRSFLWYIDQLIFPQQPTNCKFRIQRKVEEENFLAVYWTKKDTYTIYIPKLAKSIDSLITYHKTRNADQGILHPTTRKAVLFSIACHEVRHRLQHRGRKVDFSLRFFSRLGQWPKEPNKITLQLNNEFVEKERNNRPNNEISQDEFDAQVIERIAAIHYRPQMTDQEIYQILFTQQE